MRIVAISILVALSGCGGGKKSDQDQDAGPCDTGGGSDPAEVAPVLAPAFRGSANPGLAGAGDITNRTGENPTTATWDGKVVVRRCADPTGTVYLEQPTGGQPGVLAKQYWCFHAFRPSLVTLDESGAPDFSGAFGPGFMSTRRHVSHSGGFPVVENQSPAARWNPYPSDRDGLACGAASLEQSPPPCPDQAYATYDVYIIHTVGPTNPTLATDYPDYPYGEGTAVYFEQMLIVVRDPETPAATVVDVIRDSTPYPMVADPDGFGFVYNAGDPTTRNPYLYRASGDSNTYVGGVETMEPSATVDGRMVIFNGGDENPYGTNLIYTWNPDPANPTGWSPPKNVAYMYYVEGPGAPGGETQIRIGGVDYNFSDIFPIARQPLRDQEGELFNPGSTYVPATRNSDPAGYPYAFDEQISGEQYLGSYPWLSWDGRNIMSLSNGRFNLTVVGDLTGYNMVFMDGGIDRTDAIGPKPHEISAMWNLGQWPGRWAQYGTEFEGKERTIPTRVGDAVTWAVFEQDHYSEISFRKTDGSYQLYFPMSRMRKRAGNGYKDGFTPDVSGKFHTGALVGDPGQIGFTQNFSEAGYSAQEKSRVFGFSGQSIAFLADESDPDVQPHIAADPITGLDNQLTVEAAVYLQGGSAVPANPWATIARQPGAFALGIDDTRHAWFEVTDVKGDPVVVAGAEPVPEDAWVHLAGVYDGAELRLYIDGEPVAVEPGTGEAVHESSDSFAVGPKNDGADPGGNGLVFIDEVGITAGARRPEEIAYAAFKRLEWPGTPLEQWESVWGDGAMPLGLADPDGGLLAPIHLGYQPTGDLEAEKRLGEELFADGALSTTDPPISCKSCHELSAEDFGARRGEAISTRGAGRATRHTPTVFNRVFGTRQFWDGRAHSLGDQIPQPIASPAEMNMPLDELTGTVLPDAGYGPEFCDAFGSSEITVPRLQEAITLYESGLVAGNSAVDRHRFLGEPLSESAERGKALFATKARCIGCHPPPLYTDERFHDNAQAHNGDAGRAAITGRASDQGTFRTMTLRDVDRTPPYMHDGSVATLEDVVNLYNAGGDGTVDEMKPLGLTAQEVSDLVAFLEALHSDSQVIPLE